MYFDLGDAVWVFSSSYIKLMNYLQTSSTQALMLPVPGDCLQILVDFLYSDDAPGVTGKQNIKAWDNNFTKLILSK